MKIDSFFNVFGTTSGIMILVLGLFFAGFGLLSLPMSLAGFIGPIGVWTKNRVKSSKARKK